MRASNGKDFNEVLAPFDAGLLPSLFFLCTPLGLSGLPGTLLFPLLRAQVTTARFSGDVPLTGQAILLGLAAHAWIVEMHSPAEPPGPLAGSGTVGAPGHVVDGDRNGFVEEAIHLNHEGWPGARADGGVRAELVGGHGVLTSNRPSVVNGALLLTRTGYCRIA
ncbi:hypothetical protein AB0F64_12935 [Streptomyces sp. NPDC026294]|uniref:hypothetical protein n=1 Tax=Streptomyces sp. NPDC026294 TaxID=3155362 RepID=UPI0033C01265